MNTSFPTSGPIRLHVELDDGDLTTRTSATTDRVEVTIDGPRAEEFTVEQRGDIVDIRAPRGRARFLGATGKHHVRVSLPEDSDLTTRAGSAQVTAHGRYAAISGKSGSGDLQVETAQSVSILAGSGTVRCGEVCEHARVKTGSGDVSIGTAAGDAGISTGSGDTLLGQAWGRLNVKTGSGDLRVGRMDGDLMATTASGSLGVDCAVRGQITARSASGDITIGVRSGTAVWTDVLTVTGRAASQLPHSGAPAAGQDTLRLTVQSASGDVLLVPVEAGPQDSEPRWAAGSPQDARTGAAAGAAQGPAGQHGGPARHDAPVYGHTSDYQDAPAPQPSTPQPGFASSASPASPAQSGVPAEPAPGHSDAPDESGSPTPPAGTGGPGAPPVWDARQDAPSMPDALAPRNAREPEQPPTPPAAPEPEQPPTPPAAPEPEQSPESPVEPNPYLAQAHPDVTRVAAGAPDLPAPPPFHMPHDDAESGRATD